MKAGIAAIQADESVSLLFIFFVQGDFVLYLVTKVTMFTPAVAWSKG